MINRRQLEVVSFAVLAVVSISFAAAMFPTAVGGDTQSSRSGVFTDENVTLSNPPGPSGLNLSEIPWLQVYYQYFEQNNQNSGSEGVNQNQRGGTDILPILAAIGTLLGVVGVGSIVIWITWLRSAPDTSAVSSFETLQTADAEEATTRPFSQKPSPSNGVHRAWYQMVRQLQIPNWESRTPRELAELATERGFDSEAVDTIATQFEQVRYGEEAPTSDRESRTSDALERIREDRNT